MKDIKSSTASRSWFCVWNNPQKQAGMEHLSPKEIVEKAIAMWTDGKPARSCAINYEIGDIGKTPHLHMVLEDPAKPRFSAVCKLFPGIHCEATKGSKEDVEAYIYKTGKFAEKNHTIVVQPIFHGDIKGRGVRVNPQTVLLDIEDMINNGMTPEQIMELSIMYREKEPLIRSTYFAKRFKETPALRSIIVNYHVGASGSGKSYTFVQYIEQYGSENIYLASDHSENGMFDRYNGEPYLFIDELRYMKYEILLQVLQGYRSQMHARYANTYALWTQVDITSILPPEKLYENIVPELKRSDDGFAQLKRRITTIVYHYKRNGSYRTFELPASDYVDYNSLLETVHGNKDNFVPIQSLPDAVQQSLPFDTGDDPQH